MALTYTCLLLFGCSSGDCNDCLEKKLDCNCCPQIEQTAAKRASIQNVLVFLETSGSMKGYMPSNNQTSSFQEVIPNFISKLSSFNSSEFIIPESKELPQQISNDELMMRITKASFKWGQYTSIPVMLDTINHYQDQNNVTVLISDMIYSPREQKEVSQTITEISERVGKKGIASSLVSLSSDFYDGQGKRIEGAPYYLLFQGKQENIEAVKIKLFSSLNIYQQTYQETNFGYSYASPYYSIVPYVQNDGKGVPQDCNSSGRYLQMAEVKSDDGLSFWMGIDLKNLPQYALDNDYLKRNLVLESSGLKGSITDVLESKQFESIAEDEDDKKIVKNCTHFIKISARQIEDQIGVINISIKNIQPTWINNYNHEDATKADLIRNQTFGLKKIYTALKDAYHENEQGTFFKQVKISLKK